MVFLDEACAGHYRLITRDLIPLRQRGLDQAPAEMDRGGSGGRKTAVDSRSP